MKLHPLALPLGKHIVADFQGARALHDPIAARDALVLAAHAAGAVVLDVKLHDFGDRSGFTGVALLAESHISIHTWPEYDYAAIDIFMCGDADPQRSLQVLEEYFAPTSSKVNTIERGLSRDINAMLAEATL
ncbi:adenosylmethionine decarboxylase [Sulfitobacter sp.]|uniref:adenosylmethionine decarboxylase n=1 Tax=Sulfitobacter sp. TaxID=1903071 RepID=UPI0030022010